MIGLIKYDNMFTESGPIGQIGQIDQLSGQKLFSLCSFESQIVRQKMICPILTVIPVHTFWTPGGGANKLNAGHKPDCLMWWVIARLIKFTTGGISLYTGQQCSSV